MGKRIATHGGAAPIWREVVGVVRDVKVMTIGEDATPQIFYPVLQFAETQFTVVARTTGDPVKLSGDLRALLKEIDPTMPVMAAGLLTDQVSTALFPVRFAAMLLTVLGFAGLAIAAIGLYGIIAQGVAARTRELGIRIALGADPRLVRTMVLVDGLKLASVGLVIGVIIAAVASRVLATWLYGVSALDPLSFVTVPLVLMAVAAAACLIPARRATRVDPVNALRVE
jgi:putative ABC transport system permease protein